MPAKAGIQYAMTVRSNIWIARFRGR